MSLRFRKTKEIFFLLIAKAITLLSVILLSVLLYHIIREGVDYLKPHFFTNLPSRIASKSGIKAGLVGSLWLISFTALFSIPLGIASAIFLEEYKIRGKLGKIIEINVSNLAGVPSVVYGLLGLALFVNGFGLGPSLLSGALTLSLLILPVIIVASREAIKAVPDSIRQAAYGLGATKWQVVWGQVLPVALPGIMTGVILAISRAIGEAAPLIIVGAVSYVSMVSHNPLDEYTAMPIQIFNWASRPQESFHRLAATGIIVLVSLMLILNLIAVVIRYRSAKRVKL